MGAKTMTNTEAQKIAELDKKIVKIKFSETVGKKRHKSTVDTKELLELASRIRKTYDYQGTVFDRSN